MCIGRFLIPFASHPDFPYDWEDEHDGELQEPEHVPESSARLLALVGGRDATLVLHLGGAHADRPSTSERFVQTLRPEKEVLRHLAL